MEFNDEKFLLTRQEANQIEDCLDIERQRIKELTGIYFKSKFDYSNSCRLTMDDINKLIEKSAGINAWIKALIWNYVRDNSDAGTSEQKQLFLSEEDLVDAETLRDTALLWEKNDLPPN